MSTLSTQVCQIAMELRESFPQRDDAINAMLLGVLSKQHVFVLGPPGTAKSLLAREVFSRFEGSSYFEVLLSKSRPDAAILGPYDLRLLRDESKFVRKDAGYLTSVDFAFLDELGKMSPTSGHDILAALNERIKHEVSNGRAAQPIPLRTVISASNELPAAESEDAAALWDRLLFRVEVDYLSSPADFQQMLLSGPPTSRTTIPFDAFALIDAEIADVEVGQETLDGLFTLRSTLRNDGVIVSDRRWRDSLGAIKANAWLEGRTKTTVDDLAPLRHILWEDVETRRNIERKVFSAISPVHEEISNIEDLVAEIKAQVDAAQGIALDALASLGIKEVMPKVNAAEKKAKQLIDKASTPAHTDRINGLLASLQGVRDWFSKTLTGTS